MLKYGNYTIPTYNKSVTCITLYSLRTVKVCVHVRLRAEVPENSHADAPSRDAPHPPTGRGSRSTDRWRGIRRRGV